MSRDHVLELLRQWIEDDARREREAEADRAAIRALSSPRDLGNGAFECVFCGYRWLGERVQHNVVCRIPENAPAIQRATEARG